MISVIIPVYNKERSLKKTIHSVLSQSFKDLEILCVNDGSTDSSLEILKSFDDKRIRIVSQANSGVSAARNKGLELSKGEWLFFLDADDELLPAALETLHNLATSGNYFFAVGNIIIKSRKEKLYCGNKKNRPCNNVFKEIVLNRCLPRTGNVLFMNNVLKEEFNILLSKNEDIDFFSRLLKDKKGIISNKSVMKYVLENNNLSKKHNKEKDYIYHIELNKFNFWGKLYFGAIIWDNLPSSLEAINNFRSFLYFSLSFLPYMYRMIRYKLSPSL